MTGFRTSPLSKEGLEHAQVTLRERDIVDINILTQEVTLANKTKYQLNFKVLLGDKSCKIRKTAVYNLAKAQAERIEDGGSSDTVYRHYISFSSYVRFCDKEDIDPFSKAGFLSYCGRDGELARLVALKIKPVDYIYLYENGAEVGLKESSASGFKSDTTQCLIAAKVFNPRWDRDTLQFKGNKSPVTPYSQKEFNSLLRHLQLVFFSITSQLIASKEKDEHLEKVTTVIDELENGEFVTIDLHDTAPKRGNMKTNHQSPFNIAMSAGYLLFCHYSSFNTTSILNVCHPIKLVEDRKLNRTTKYVSIRAWKSRANKVVEGVFSQEPIIDDGYVNLEIDKRDGLTFINTLSKLSELFNPQFNNEPNPPLLYSLSNKDGVKPLHLQMGARTLNVLFHAYIDNKAIHAPYLIERFNEVVDKKIITEVRASNGIIVKKPKKLLPRDVKKRAISLAFGALRALTDNKLKGICMPLTYSDADARGYVHVSFKYDSGLDGSFEVENRHIPFLRTLESYSAHYNPVKISKRSNAKKCTPYLLPLGSKLCTYQWEGKELPFADYLKKIGIYIGDYYLSLNAQKFRSTSANNNFNPNDGGLGVATSLLQNTVATLREHYINGLPMQNQLIASQAIEVLEAYTKGTSLEDAKSEVKKRRKIEVLEYDEWKALRMPTNLNGLLCGGEPSGDAVKEHRTSTKISQSMLDEGMQITCYQYDKCIDCKSAKLVNDVHSAYKLLSYVELLEDSASSMTERAAELNERAESLLTLAENNLSGAVLEAAEKKLIADGRYLLHNNDFLGSMEAVNYYA